MPSKHTSLPLMWMDPNQQGVQVTVHGRLSQLVERAIEERLALIVR